MTCTREQIVKVMQSWIGSVEGGAMHHAIIDLYNTQSPLPAGYRVKYTDSWCATTVSAAALACNAPEIFPCECSCARMITKASQMGIWVEDDAFVPKPGDCVLYDWGDKGIGDCTGHPEHVGMVEKVDGMNITVIEGNKNDTVGRRTLQINGKFIRGYVTPRYSDAATPVITVPSDEVRGLDTSKYQSSMVDYSKAKKSGYSFAILRIGCNHTKDPNFDNDFARVQNSGLLYGVYYAVSQNKAAIDVDTAVQYAKECIAWLNGATLTLPIAFDIEGSPYNVASRKQANAEIYNAFANVVKEAGYACMLYTGMSLFNYAFDSSKIKDPLWIARYSTKEPDVGRQVAIWQYTSKEDLTDFYTFALDRNKMLVPYKELMKTIPVEEHPVSVIETKSKSKTTAAPLGYEASFSGDWKAKVNVNMRYGPNAETYESIDVVGMGKKVKCYGYYSITGQYVWLYIEYNGKVGYINSKYLTR